MQNISYHVFYSDGGHEETENPNEAKKAIREGHEVVKVTFVTIQSGKTRITASISTEISLISEV
jgi:hypothetical protein